MASFGKSSKEKLATCDPRLRSVMNEAISYFDFTIIQGHRTMEEQNKAYAEGKSKLQYPHSKHNSYPSKAVDIAPWFKTKPHIRWDDKAAFYFLAGHIMTIAALQGVKIRWGGDWDMDQELHDQTFFDLPHFQLKN